MIECSFAIRPYVPSHWHQAWHCLRALFSDFVLNYITISFCSVLSLPRLAQVEGVQSGRQSCRSNVLLHDQGFSGYHQGSSEQLPQAVALTETLAVSSLWVWLIAGFTTAAVRMLDEDADGLPLGQ